MTQQPDPFSELRGLIEKAAPGPWGVEPSPTNLWIGPSRPHGKVGDIVCALHPDPDYHDDANARIRANAALIVAAVNALPALLDERHRLIKALKRAERALTPFADAEVAFLSAKARHRPGWSPPLRRDFLSEGQFNDAAAAHTLARQALSQEIG